MLEDKIKSIADREGWSEATLVSVLIGVLEDLSSHDFPANEDSIIRAVWERAHG